MSSHHYNKHPDDGDPTLIWVLIILLVLVVCSVLGCEDAPTYTQETQTYVAETVASIDISEEVQYNIDIVTATLIGEAGGEYYDDSLLAVLCVIRNRTDIQYEDMPDVVSEALKDECLKKWQFSMWNAATCYDRLTVDTITNLWRSHARWDEAQTLVWNLVFSPETFPADPTRGAKHYHADYAHPSWTHPNFGGKNENAIVTTVIGKHIFLRNVD